MNQALYAHMNNKRKMKKKKPLAGRVANEMRQPVEHWIFLTAYDMQKN
jgi:hypothetical protein